MIGHLRLDGGPDTFYNKEDTEIPALRRYVYDITIQRRHEFIRRFGENSLKFLQNLAHFLSGFFFFFFPFFSTNKIFCFPIDEGTIDPTLRNKLKNDIDRRLSIFTKTLNELLQQLQVNIDQAIKNSIISKV